MQRTQILDAIRSGSGINVRYLVHSLSVIKGSDATFAYAVVTPSQQEYDGGEFILESRAKKGREKWRVIWSVNGGGTNDCVDVAAYYAAITRYLKAHNVAANALNSGHTKTLENLSAAAAQDQSCTTIGDLGPNIETPVD